MKTIRAVSCWMLGLVIGGSALRAASTDDVYPDLIRENERKPIRIFLQDGLNDNRGRRRGGRYDPKWDWHAQNRKMVEALTAKGYEVNYTWVSRTICVTLGWAWNS